MRNILNTIIPVTLLLIPGSIVLGQTEKQAIRQGNREFKKGEFLESEISYRSALEQNPSSFKGNFNLGGALYKQQNYDEAVSIYEDLKAANISEKDKAKIYHNLGNTLFNQEKYAESVEAYKNSLRLNPKDNETRYNLAQAQRKLIQQQQQQQNNQGDSDNKDQKDNKDQDQNKDKQEKQDQQDQQNNQDQQNQQDKKDQHKEQQQQISPEDARRMLEAIQNNERDVQERVRDQQAKSAKVKVEKNW